MKPGRRGEMKPGDRVIVNCPNYEDYKAIVRQCKSTWVKVSWVDNDSWEPLDPQIYKPEWKPISKVEPWKSTKPLTRGAKPIVIAEDDEDEDDEDYEEEEDDAEYDEEDDKDGNDEGCKDIDHSAKRQKVRLEDLKYQVDEWKDETIDFGMSKNGVLYRKQRSTFDVVSKTDRPFLKYAKMVVSGKKPLNDDDTEQAAKYIEFCQLKEDIRRHISSSIC